MIFAAVVIFGIYSLVKLPVDFYPEVEFPAITIMTIYSGANASDIETNVSRPIEDAVNSVDNLKEVTSVSRDNLSIVTIEFEWETNLDEAANDIRNALEFVEDDLPDDSESPIIYKFNSSMMPILFYSVTANESYQGIEKLLDERLINRLNRIEGIGSVSLSGVPGREVFIEVDPLKLEAYNLSVEMIGGILQAENINIPSGNVEMGNMDYQLKIEGEFASSDEINDLVIGTFNGQTIYMRNVATVRDTIRDMSIEEIVNGEKSIKMIVMKQSGANTIKVAKDVRETIAMVKKDLPVDVHIEPIFDSSTFISQSVNNLSQTLLYALFFVILVILFFLGRWRATFIVVLTIPISLIVAFIYLAISGNSINIISLSSLSIAIGMVVDDAIVVLENISTHIERGSSPREAAIYATNEVWMAVIVTTLVVVAVFFPLTLVSGMTGVLFRQLGWIVTIVTVTSTVVAITLTPMLASKMLKMKKPTKVRKLSYSNTILRLLDGLDRFYERTLRVALKRRLIVLVVAIGVFVASLALIPKIGTEFIPQSDESYVSAVIELQTGTRVDKTIEVAKQIEALMYERYPEARLVNTSSGADDAGGISSIWGTNGSNIINLSLRLVDVENRDRSCWDIGEDLRKQLDLIPEIVNYNIAYSGGMGGFGGNTVDVKIFGYDFETTNLLAEEISNKISEIPGARDVNISREKSKPELKVVLDREKMAQYGLNTFTVSMALRNRVDGLIATKLREKGDEYNVIVRYKEEYRNSITDIENIVVTNSQGMSVRISDIGTVQEHWSPPNIERERRERIVKVSVKPYQVSLGELAAQIQQKIDETEVPDEVLIEVGGAFEDQQDSFADLGLLMLVSLLLVYIVMASQFESFKMPFIIMFAIPFSFTGVLLALFFTGTTLSTIAALGSVLLIGIVVKNAIVLVDYINLMRDRGMELNEAIAVAGRSRLRPVLMTAATTILGLLPMAMSTGEGSEIWSPMGISVIGGLIFSTIITMVLVPVIYAMFSRRGERKRKTHQLKYEFMENDV
jgi:HAE1 family hydrophobic/amphiphilic exporter-1